jgi:hypothetical protein
MPKHHVSLTVENSPQRKIKLGPFKTEDVAEAAKNALVSAKDCKIVQAKTEEP